VLSISTTWWRARSRFSRGGPDLAAAWAARYPWISVDEDQDVDPLQYRLLRALAPGAAKLTVVGDPDQSIYAFRGADVAFFLRFRDDYPSARVVELRRNYRATATLVEVAAAAIRPASLVPDRRLQAMAEGGEAITVVAAATAQAEAEQVVATVGRLTGGPTCFSLDCGRAGSGEPGYGFSAIAILHGEGGPAGWRRGGGGPSLAPPARFEGGRRVRRGSRWSGRGGLAGCGERSAGQLAGVSI